MYKSLTETDCESPSKQRPLELYDNPFIPLEERLEIAIGSANFWKKCYAHQLKQKNEILHKLEQAEEHINMAFHPEVGWAISPEEHARILDQLSRITPSYSPKMGINGSIWDEFPGS